jgi:CBS domain-containing protein
MTSATVTDSISGTLRSAAVAMWRQQTGSLVIVDGGSVVGIVTERDIMRVIASGKDVDAVSVGEAMTADVITTGPDTPIRDAARIMAQHWIRHLPVVQGGELRGIVSQRDVTGVFAALWRETGLPEIDTDTLVRQRRLERIEAGDLD